MSLRIRLLVVTGVVALAALAIAELVTYSALQSYLYGRVDSQLEQSRVEYTHLLESGASVVSCAGPGGSAAPGANGGGPGVSDGGGTLPTNAPQTQAVTVLGSVKGGPNSISCPSYVDGAPYGPALNKTVLRTLSPGAVLYFDAQATRADGPLFRVQASVLSNGGILVIAQPVANEANTLHRLVAVELTVTAAAMAVALLVGSFLVRAGLAPLTDMEHTARSIAEGLTVAEGGGAVVSSDESHDIDEESTDDLQSTDPDDSGTDGWSDEKPRASGPTLDDDLVTIELLSQRVPGANDRTEVGRLATTLNVMLDRIEAAFVARVDSERKLIASEEQLRRFVADASHELRTPIAAISAYAELFERGAKGRPEDLERLLSGVRSEAARMGRLVADLLLLARLDDGEERGADLVDLAVLVGDAVSTATVVGPEWPVVLFAGGSVEVIGDAGALRQVFDNLLANVRAHTPKGTTASVVVSSSMGVARVEVSDDGPGIPADRLAHVFDRFWRADPGRSRDKGGTGLGLAIVKSLVESQEGRVQVSSTFGAGTSFVVELPEAVII